MIDWSTFPLVVGVALVAACVLVTLFSLALRVGDGTESWRRPASVGLFVLCALVVAFGIYLIVPALHAFG
ncbi:MAG: hypothetical protein JWR04_665 [Rhodoglobus sp.]|nr:hypothetical protein [Rhodoglobus sp.]